MIGVSHDNKVKHSVKAFSLKGKLGPLNNGKRKKTMIIISRCESNKKEEPNRKVIFTGLIYVFRR